MGYPCVSPQHSATKQQTATVSAHLGLIDMQYLQRPVGGVGGQQKSSSCGGGDDDSLPRSSSQPDLAVASSPVHHWSPGVSMNAVSPDDDLSSALQVIRVWKAADGGKEQASKLVPVRRSTTAAEAVVAVCEEFGIPHSTDEERESYCLSQVRNRFFISRNGLGAIFQCNYKKSGWFYSKTT